MQTTELFVYEGVMVMVPIAGVVPLLVAIKDGIVPVPLNPNPMLVLLFNQLYTVPGTLPLSVTEVVLPPLHTT